MERPKEKIKFDETRIEWMNLRGSDGYLNMTMYGTGGIDVDFLIINGTENKGIVSINEPDGWHGTYEYKINLLHGDLYQPQIYGIGNLVEDFFEDLRTDANKFDLFKAIGYKGSLEKYIDTSCEFSIDATKYLEKTSMIKDGRTFLPDTIKEYKKSNRAIEKALYSLMLKLDLKKVDDFFKENDRLTTNEYTILQLDNDCDYKFIDYDTIKKEHKNINIDDYHEAYKGTLDDIEMVGNAERILDKIYYKFNMDEKPKDYKGHSLSVSDIIKLGDELYFVDSFGFKKLDGFDKNKEVDLYER